MVCSGVIAAPVSPSLGSSPHPIFWNHCHTLPNPTPPGRGGGRVGTLPNCTRVGFIETNLARPAERVVAGTGRRLGSSSWWRLRQKPTPPLGRIAGQSVFGWPGPRDVNDAERLCRDPAIRWVVRRSSTDGSGCLGEPDGPV